MEGDFGRTGAKTGAFPSLIGARVFDRV